MPGDRIHCLQLGLLGHPIPCPPVKCLLPFPHTKMEAGPREDFAGIVQKGYPHMDKQSQIFSEENYMENFNTIKIQHLRSCLLKPYVIEK